MTINVYMNNQLNTKVKRGFIWSLTENLSLQIIRFVIGIVMARLLSPTDYGMVGMLTVFIVISDLLINSGVGSALNKMQNRTEEDYSTAFIFNVSIGVLLFIVLFAVSPYIASFYNVPMLKDLMKIQALSLIINSLGIIPITKLQIQLNFKYISISSVISSIISGITGILLAYNNFGVWALVYSTISGNISRVILLYATVRWVPHTGFSLSSFKKMFSYGSKLLLGTLIDTIYNNIYPLVVGKVYSATTLGYYTRAQGYANLPTSTLGSMIYRVCFPAFCAENNDKKALLISYNSIMKSVSIATFFIMILLLSLAKPLIIILVTDKWINCVPMLKILCIATIWYPILEVNLSLIKALGFSSTVLKIQIINKSFAMLVLALTVQYSIIIMCWGAALVALFSLFVNFWFTSKISGLSLNKLLEPIKTPIIAGLSMYIIITLISYFIDNIYLECILGIILGSIIYCTISTILGYPLIRILNKTLKQLLNH